MQDVLLIVEKQGHETYVFQDEHCLIVTRALLSFLIHSSQQLSKKAAANGLEALAKPDGRLLQAKT
jgi:hypothetical protein